MRKIRRKVSIGLSLTILGLIMILVCSVPVTSTEKVINTSLTINPGTKYGPYNEGTTYHTRILSKSVLKGKLIVEGEGIYLTIEGYNTKHLKNIYVYKRYSFTIDPANDLYTFIFDNTKGNTGSLVKFILEEIWTRPMLWTGPNGSVSKSLLTIGTIGFILLLTGLITLTITHFKYGERNLYPHIYEEIT